MSDQDGLLTFRIRETVFLPPDQAGIGNVTELELLPDVEIAENDQELSITGCLRLHGSYEPVRGQGEEPEEAEGLVAEMKFSPFVLEEEEAASPLPLTPEEGILHRIPLNIAVPRTRIAAIEDVYAVVDHFDYEVKGPRELVIQGVLKIIGIHLDDRLEQANKAETQEYVHTVDPAVQPDFPPTTLDELERRLAQLEREVKAELDGERAGDSPYANRYAQPFYGMPGGWFLEHSPPQPIPSAHNPQLDAHPHPAHPSQAAEPPAAEAAERPREPVQDSDVQVRAKEAGMSGDASADLAHGTTEVLGREQSAGGNVIDLAAVLNERAAEQSAAESEAPAVMAEPAGELHGEAEAVEEGKVARSAPSAQEAEQEVRVAISSKPTPETGEPLNLSSLFANAGRVYAEQVAAERPEESSSSTAPSLPAADEETYHRTLEAMNTLASVANTGEERFSKLKMCIAQRQDTLEKIAERYAVPVSRLMEVNNLSSDRLEAGQVLYIPQ